MRAGSDGSDLNEAPETFELYSPFVGFDNCYDSSGQLNKADKRYFTPIKVRFKTTDSYTNTELHSRVFAKTIFIG